MRIKKIANRKFVIIRVVNSCSFVILKKMIEIRIHGRGGQGIVTAAELLSLAAHEDGKMAQGFPTFGAERMGSPVAAFVRIDEKKIRLRTAVLNPDYVIVQDPTMISRIDVFAGLKPNGLALLNSETICTTLPPNTTFKVICLPATKIALEIIGRDVPNTTLLGAFSALSKLYSLDALKKAIEHRFSAKLVTKNIQAAEKGYELIKKDFNE